MQPGSQEASSVCDKITELAIGREEDDDNATSFTVLSKVRSMLTQPFGAAACLSFVLEEVL